MVTTEQYSVILPSCLNSAAGLKSKRLPDHDKMDTEDKWLNDRLA